MGIPIQQLLQQRRPASDSSDEWDEHNDAPSIPDPLLIQQILEHKLAAGEADEAEIQEMTQVRSKAVAEVAIASMVGRRQRAVESSDEWDDEDEEPSWAGAPLTTKEKDMLRYVQLSKNNSSTGTDMNIGEQRLF